MNINVIHRAPGRPSNKIEYTHVTYLGSEYVVGKVKSKNTYVKFIIDKEDFHKIEGYTWHKSSNYYISHGIIIDSKKKELYLHNIILNLLDFPGKGSKESVDHINRIGLDNRKENLRIVTQSEQILNQSKRKRTVELPEHSKIIVNDIPKHIWYIKANGSHGDRFAIEFKTENIIWKTTASKGVSIEDKLEVAKKKLEEYYIIYPYLNPHDEVLLHQIKKLEESYNEIIKLAI